MKYLIATGLLACTIPALAQSTVTIYGIVDANGQYLDGRAKTGRVQSGGLSASRLGFRGVEDLSGGLRAFFTLESGFNLDDGTIGQGGTFYGRQAFVGLQGGFGEVSLGRQYGSLYQATNGLSIFGNQPAGPSTGVIGGFSDGYEPVRGASTSTPGAGSGATGQGSPVRVNNSIRYETPAFSGFKASALYGAGEVSGGTHNTRLFDLGLYYTGYGFDAIVSYVDDKAQRAGPAGTNARTLTLAARYTLAPFRVVAGLLDVDDKRPANLDGKGFWMGGEYRIGAHLLKAQYVQNKPKYGSDNKTNAYGIGWAYDLSKRTALYSSLTRFDNDGNAGAGGLGRFHSAVPAGLTAVGNNGINEFVLGVRHSF